MSWSLLCCWHRVQKVGVWIGAAPLPFKCPHLCFRPHTPPHTHPSGTMAPEKRLSGELRGTDRSLRLVLCPGCHDNEVLAKAFASLVIFSYACIWTPGLTRVRAPGPSARAITCTETLSSLIADRQPAEEHGANATRRLFNLHFKPRKDLRNEISLF